MTRFWRSGSSPLWPLRPITRPDAANLAFCLQHFDDEGEHNTVDRSRSRFPPAGIWCVALGAVSGARAVVECSRSPGYALNAALVIACISSWSSRSAGAARLSSR